MGISVVYNSAIAMYYLQTHDQINAMKTIKKKRKKKKKETGSNIASCIIKLTSLLI
jgi:hypothetical protein